MTTRPEQPRAAVSTGVSRRGLLGGAVAGAGVVSGALSAGLGLGRAPAAGALAPLTSEDAAVHGEEFLPVHGVHQAGVTAPPTAHSRYLAFDLLPNVDVGALERLFRILTADIESLTVGLAPLADTEPELAELPARLTITVGFGPGLVDIAAPARRPEWLAALPLFPRDELDPAYGDGDLLLVIESDDPVTVAHAARMLTKDIRSFASIRWRQDGFRRSRGSEPDGRTMRNLMGQVDGTTNPHPEDEDFAGLVWHDESAGWLEHGSAVVIRRIRMELDTWDQVDRVGREQTIGRDLAAGAPLTGGDEFTDPDFEQKDALGFAVIPEYAHIRRARSEDPAERIYRRAVNYDEGDEQGLLFVCYQRDPLRQFVPIQQRLDDLDLLNEWVTHVGSAVFAVAPGWQEGGMLGETLLQAAHSSG